MNYLKETLKNTFKKKGKNRVIDCKFVAKLVKRDVEYKIMSTEITPVLAIVNASDDYASFKYVNNKIKACESTGIKSKLISIHQNAATTEKIIKAVEDLNKDSFVDAIIVQLPLPSNVDTRKVLNSIAPEKDLDCLNPYNVGLLHLGKPFVEPCTPAGIIKMLTHYGFTIKGKNVLMIGRSDIVGKPLAELLTSKDATVTLAHSKSEYNPDNYDIVISAIGKAKSIVVNNPKAILIDVGINTDENGKLVGDFDIEKCNCAYYTSVPGGVGPLTTSMVCYNTLKLALRSRGIDKDE